MAFIVGVGIDDVFVFVHDSLLNNDWHGKQNWRERELEFR